MKKIIRITIIAACGIYAASCAKQEIFKEVSEESSVKMEKSTFKAIVETGTKSSINLETGAVEWTVGDKIKFIWELDNTPGSSVSEALAIEDIDEGVASFTAEIPEDFSKSTSEYSRRHLYVVYPSTVEHDYSNATTFYLTVPKVQDGTFANASIAVAKWNALDVTAPLEFKNLCGLLQIVITDDSVRKIVLNANTHIAGKASVTWADAINPGVPVAKSIVGGENEISVDVNGAGTYYVAVLPSDMAGIYVALYDGSGNLVGDKASDKMLSVVRKQLCKLGTIPAGNDMSDRYFVKAGGTGDGTSWDNAAGVDGLKGLMTSSTAVVNKKVYMAEGDYIIANVNANAKTSSSLKIYGGYPSDAAGNSLAGRDAGTHVTTIKNGSGRTFYTNVDGVTWVFDGITFNSKGYSGADGCALTLIKGDILINNCRFVGSEHGGSAAGAVRVGCNATFRNCTFSDNAAIATAGNGGAVYVRAGATGTFERCIFSGNTSTERGGAIYSLGDVRLTDCAFNDNFATTNGGTVCVAGGTAYFDRCYFYCTDSSKDSRSICTYSAGEVIGFNNCLFTGGYGSTAKYNIYNTVSGAKLIVANTTMAGQISEGIIGNAAGCNAYIINSIVLNAASSGAGKSWGNNNAGTLNVDFCLYAVGTTGTSINNSLGGVKFSTDALKNFPVNNTWYKTNSAAMYSANQTSSSRVSDCRGEVHFYAWDGVYPTIDGKTFTNASMPAVATLIQTADTDFYNWLVSNEKLGVDIRGIARKSSSTWPGSFEN